MSDRVISLELTEQDKNVTAARTAIEVWAGAYCYYPKPKELKPIDWTDRKSKQATPPKAGKDDKD